MLNKDTEWRRPEDNPYKEHSVLKVLLQPPRRNILPVLPYRHKGRLTFPLCRECVHVLSGNCGWRLKYRCRHSDQQRSWVGTYASIELNKALEAGYVVKRVMRVLEWEEGDAHLFRSYMAEFMAWKIQASGYPPDVKGDLVKEAAFIEKCWVEDGIKLDPTKMKANSGKRALSKSFLTNSCKS